LTNALSGWAGVTVKAAIEVGDEVLLEIAVGGAVIGNAFMPKFLRQQPLIGAEGTLAAAEGLR
jgi:hypothetical protein